MDKSTKLVLVTTLIVENLIVIVSDMVRQNTFVNDNSPMDQSDKKELHKVKPLMC